MGKNDKKQSHAGRDHLGVNHQNTPLHKFDRTRTRYVTGKEPVPPDFDTLLLNKGFTLAHIRKLRRVSNNGNLKALYDHCNTTPNLMDAHGFTAENMTRIMGVYGGAHNLDMVCKHIETLKLCCSNDNNKIAFIASHTGGSCSIEALCSEMRVTLISVHGFTMEQVVDLVSRVGGKRKLELAHLYAERLLLADVSHKDIITCLKASGSAESAEYALRDMLKKGENVGQPHDVIVNTPIQLANNMMAENSFIQPGNNVVADNSIIQAVNNSAADNYFQPIYQNQHETLLNLLNEMPNHSVSDFQFNDAFESAEQFQSEQPSPVRMYTNLWTISNNNNSNNNDNNNNDSKLIPSPLL